MKLLMNQKDELLEVEQRAKLRQAQAAGTAIQELDALKLKHETLQATIRKQEETVSSVSKESLFWNDEVRTGGGVLGTSLCVFNLKAHRFLLLKLYI